VVLNLPISHHLRKRICLPRSRVVYYGVPDLQRDAKPLGGERAEPVLPSAAFAYVGRLVKEKGLPVLLQAARQLKNAGSHFRLKIIGEGPERANLEKSAIAMGIDSHVGFTGQLQGNALQAALEDVSAVVMPSLWEETAGLAAMEHMMRGRIVIASDVGGLGEVVDDAGLKFPMGDATGLESCLRCVLEDSSLVRVLGRKARERALRLFLRERMIVEHVALYRQLVREWNRLPTFVSEEDDARST
jgi:glycosyltransferase involved in cell wall biosynthesis